MAEKTNEPVLAEDEYVFTVSFVVKNPNGYDAAEEEFEARLREWGFDDKVQQIREEIEELKNEFKPI
jgi:hypothetical protein